MLDLTKPMRRASDKAPVRLLCSDRKWNSPERACSCFFLVETAVGEQGCWTHADGYDLDRRVQVIENVPETITGYVNVYPDMFAIYTNLDTAERCKWSNIVSLIKIEILDGEIVSSEKLK